MASRKEFELMFKLSSQVNGAFNNNMKNAQSAVASMQKEISALNKSQSDISSYQKQQQAVETTNKKLEALQKQYDNIQKEINETGKFSSELENKLIDKQQQIDKTTTALGQQTDKLNQMETSLQNAGINTGNLTEEEKRLTQEVQSLKEKQMEAAENTRNLTEEEKRLIQETQQLNEDQRKAAESSEGFGEKAADAMDTIASAIVAAGVANALKEIKDAYMECIQTAGEYEETLSTVEALSGASANEMAELSGMAKQLGAQTQFTAQESAEAMTFMAMAGWETEDMLNGMDGVLQLAAASGEDLAMVSDIVTDNLTAFGMTAADTAHFSDVLASAATNSNTSVSIMGETFKQSASIAGALGYSVDDVAVAVGLMANSGIKGSIAGTALKNTFNGLLEGVTLTGNALGEYEFSALKSDGTMKSFAETINELRGVFGQLSEAEKTSNAMAIAGNRSYNGLLAIVNAADEDFNSLSDAITNCNGAASKMAAIKMDNMNGELKLAQSAWEGVTIAVGEQFTPAMGEAYKMAAKIFSWMKEFIEEHPALVKAVTVFVGVIGTATAAMTAYAAAAKVVKMLDIATLFTGPAGAAMFAVGAIASFVAGIVAITESSESAIPSVKELAEEARKLKDVMAEEEAEYKQVSTEMMAQASAAEIYIDRLAEIDNATHGNVEKNKEYKNLLQLLIRTMPELADSIDLETNSIEGGTSALRNHIEAWKQDAKVQAQQEYMNGLYDEYGAITTELAENEIKLADAKLKEKKATEEMQAAEQRMSVLMKEAEKEAESYYKKTGILEDSSRYLSNEYFELADSLQGYSNEIAEAQLNQENLTKAIEEDNAAAEEAERAIKETEAALEEMTAEERAAAEAAAELSEQSAMVSETVGNVSLRAAELAERYQESYNEAYESISGQYELWDKVAKVAAKSAGDITATMDAQTKYWQDYNANLTSLSERTGDVEGLREVIASFADGSKESVNAIAGMASASDSDLKEMVASWKNLQKEHEEASGSIAELRENFTQEMDNLGVELASDVQEMNLSAEATAAAQQTIQGFIDGANGMIGQVQAAYASVAAAAKAALGGAAGGTAPTGTNVLPGVAGSTANSQKYGAYASGTSSAEPGFALVGENGPEIVYMNGGETVLNAAETEKVKKELSVGNREMQAVQAQQEYYAQAMQQEPASAVSVTSGNAESGGAIIINNNPMIVINGDEPGDLEEKLQKNNQMLLLLIEEKLNSRRDEVRTRFA